MLLANPIHGRPRNPLKVAISGTIFPPLPSSMIGNGVIDGQPERSQRHMSHGRPKVTSRPQRNSNVSTMNFCAGSLTQFTTSRSCHLPAKRRQRPEQDQRRGRPITRRAKYQCGGLIGIPAAAQNDDRVRCRQRIGGHLHRPAHGRMHGPRRCQSGASALSRPTPSGSSAARSFHRYHPHPICFGLHGSPPSRWWLGMRSFLD